MSKRNNNLNLEKSEDKLESTIQIKYKLDK